MQSVQHQMMGYDRAITMFSPDGRLLQVEYAKKTVKQGSTALGLVCSDGVVLIADKRIIDDLIVPESIEKVFIIDNHMCAASAGIVSDARVLVERAQLKAQQHKITYDSPIDTLSIVKDTCSLKQITTQSGGLRPFGVSLLIAGVDEDKPRLFQTDPTGIYFEYLATAIGEGDLDVQEILKKEYKQTMAIQDGLKLGIKAIIKAIDKGFDIKRLECVYMTTKDRKYVRLETKEVQKIVSEIKKK